MSRAKGGPVVYSESGIPPANIVLSLVQAIYRSDRFCPGGNRWGYIPFDPVILSI